MGGEEKERGNVCVREREMEREREREIKYAYKQLISYADAAGRGGAPETQCIVISTCVFSKHAYMPLISYADAAGRGGAPETKVLGGVRVA